MKIGLTEFYIYVCESSKYFGTEVRVYEKEENAKNAVASTYEEYIINKNYKPQDENSFQEAKDEYEASDKTGFTVMLNDNEIFGCHYEKATYADFYYNNKKNSSLTK